LAKTPEYEPFVVLITTALNRSVEDAVTMHSVKCDQYKAIFASHVSRQKLDEAWPFAGVLQCAEIMRTQTSSTARAVTLLALLSGAKAAPTTIPASDFVGLSTADVFPPSGSESYLLCFLIYPG
jgi:hypothetical protein